MIFNKKALSEFFLSVIYIFYIYSVQFKFLPVDSSKLIWLLLMPIFILQIFFAKKFRRFIYFHRKNLVIPVILFFLALIIFFISEFHSTSSYTIPYYMSIYLIDFFPISLLLIYLCLNKDANCINLIVNAGVFQALLIFLMFFIPVIKHSYGSLVYINDRILDYYSYRQVGITGFANYTVGTTQVFILIVYIFEVCKDKNINFKSILIMLLLFLSSVFSSRSSLVVLAIFFLFFIPSFMKSKNFWKKYFTPFLFFSIAIFLVVIYVILHRNIFENNLMIRWALEPLINLYYQGELTTKSSETISSFYFYPGDNTFLFGDWRFINPDGSYYMSVDAGYMRLILYMGVFFSILFYSLFSLCVLSLASKLNSNLLKIFGFSFLICIFILNYKGNAFVDSSAMIKIYILYMLINTTRLKYDK